MIKNQDLTSGVIIADRRGTAPQDGWIVVYKES